MVPGMYFEYRLFLAKVKRKNAPGSRQARQPLLPAAAGIRTSILPTVGRVNGVPPGRSGRGRWWRPIGGGAAAPGGSDATALYAMAGYAAT